VFSAVFSLKTQSFLRKRGFEEFYLQISKENSLFLQKETVFLTKILMKNMFPYVAHLLLDKNFGWKTPSGLYYKHILTIVIDGRK
jgi:hypothetical protein